MITVAILINGNPLVARNAVNTGRINDKGYTLYHTDSGETVLHKPEDGAIALAHQLLDLIKNDSDASPRRRPKPAKKPRKT